jgi:hypothetical protein
MDDSMKLIQIFYSKFQLVVGFILFIQINWFIYSNYFNFLSLWLDYILMWLIRYFFLSEIKKVMFSTTLINLIFLDLIYAYMAF